MNGSHPSEANFGVCCLEIENHRLINLHICLRIQLAQNSLVAGFCENKNGSEPLGFM